VRQLWAAEVRLDPAAAVERVVALCRAAGMTSVYLSNDVDGLDPAFAPGTGTPEPGGGLWYPTLALLRELFRTKTVVAMDVVELAPLGGQPASDFLTSKLIYKCLGYLQESG